MSEKTASARPPQHPFDVLISIGGETWQYVLDTMEHLTAHLREHGPACSLLSGGGGGSHSVSVVERDITIAAFRAELAAWHDEQCRCRSSRPQDPTPAPAPAVVPSSLEAP